MFQTKEQDKSPVTDLNKIGISDLPNREFQIMVIKMLTEVREQCMNKVRISAKRKYKRQRENPKSSKIKEVCYIEGDPHKTISEFFSRNFASQEGVE